MSFIDKIENGKTPLKKESDKKHLKNITKSYKKALTSTFDEYNYKQDNMRKTRSIESIQSNEEESIEENDIEIYRQNTALCEAHTQL